MSTQNVNSFFLYIKFPGIVWEKLFLLSLKASAVWAFILFILSESYIIVERGKLPESAVLRNNRWYNTRTKKTYPEGKSNHAILNVDSKNVYFFTNDFINHYYVRPVKK